VNSSSTSLTSDTISSGREVDGEAWIFVGSELLEVVEAFDEGMTGGVDLVDPEKIKPGGRKWRLSMIFRAYNSFVCARTKEIEINC
jgi:hypothetical protein